MGAVLWDLEVEFGDGALAARVWLAVDPPAVALHLGQVLVKHLARAQRRHQVIKFTTVVLAVLLGLACLPFLVALLLHLKDREKFIGHL